MLVDDGCCCDFNAHNLARCSKRFLVKNILTKYVDKLIPESVLFIFLLIVNLVFIQMDRINSITLQQAIGNWSVGYNSYGLRPMYGTISI